MQRQQCPEIHGSSDGNRCEPLPRARRLPPPDTCGAEARAECHRQERGHADRDASMPPEDEAAEQAVQPESTGARHPAILGKIVP